MGLRLAREAVVSGKALSPLAVTKTLHMLFPISLRKPAFVPGPLNYSESLSSSKSLTA